MANQLSIPKKATSPIPLKSLQIAVAAYIQDNRDDTHYIEFESDLKLWSSLREACTSEGNHVFKVQCMIRYHAHLTFMLTKIPLDIGLQFSYGSALKPSSSMITLSNLNYERVAVLFNLASLYSQLALAEDRTHGEGIKRANAFYQNAAGTLSYLISSALTPLLQSTGVNEVPELSEPLLRSLEYLMLAQAQECAWQRAVIDRLKNGTVAKLSSKVSAYYRMCSNTIREAPGSIKQAFPQNWMNHVETKQYHFQAAAQYRKSIDDLESNKYGNELSRLHEAKILAKTGYDLARKSYVAKPVLHDIKSLSDMVETNLIRAERDNDLIYHQEIPPVATIPTIQEVSLVQSVVPPGLKDPRSVLQGESVIFGELVGWGARVAVDIYQDRRDNFLKEEILGRVSALDVKLDSILQELSLPASLDALDRPVGLPPSLLRKAEEIRVEDGPSRIDGSLENVDLLAERNKAVLDEAMDILDQEVSEDEEFWRTHANDQRALEWTRSTMANVELSSREGRYRRMLEHAAASDETVRSKWNEWEEAITRLTWDESKIEAWVPSSTVSTKKGCSPVDSLTLSHARELRALLEALEDNRRAGAQLALRAERLAEADDIRPRIMQEAAGIERWTSVEPAMFEDTLDEEISKFDTFKDGIDECADKQDELLEQLRSKHGQFLLSRKEDKSIKDRERALQSLDLAYHKYREITRNLNEGLKFYNDLHGILHKFRHACREWVRARRDEMRQLMQSLPEEGVRTPKAASPTLQKAAQRQSTQTSSPLSPEPDPLVSRAITEFSLPPPDSDEWESLPTPVPNRAHGSLSDGAYNKLFTSAKASRSSR